MPLASALRLLWPGSSARPGHAPAEQCDGPPGPVVCSSVAAGCTQSQGGIEQGLRTWHWAGIGVLHGGQLQRWSRWSRRRHWRHHCCCWPLGHGHGLRSLQRSLLDPTRGRTRRWPRYKRRSVFHGHGHGCLVGEIGPVGPALKLGWLGSVQAARLQPVSELGPGRNAGPGSHAAARPGCYAADLAGPGCSPCQNWALAATLALAPTLLHALAATLLIWLALAAILPARPREVAHSNEPAAGQGQGASKPTTRMPSRPHVQGFAANKSKLWARPTMQAMYKLPAQPLIRKPGCSLQLDS